MFCPNCGTKNEDDAAFCANCGASLTQDQSQETNNTVETQAQAPSQPEQAQAPSQPVQPQFNGQQYNAGQPVQPQFNGQQYNAGQPVQPKAPKAPFKLTKKMIGIGAGVLAVLVAIIVFVCVGKSGSDYKKTAEKYAKAVLKCDWEAAYNMVNFPESEFLTKDAYKIVNKDETPKSVAAMTVVDSNLYSSLGLSSSTIGALGKEVTVNYSAPGASQSSMDLTMDVSPKKYMLFFKQYKVSSDTLVSADTTIKIPSGTKLSINGVEVNDSYKLNDSSSSSSSSSQISYKIPYLFNGTNTIKVTGDMIEDYETTISVYYDDDYYSVSSSNLKLRENMVSAVKSQAETDLKTIADACVANKDVSAISSRVYSSAMTKVSSYYKYALQDCHSASKNVTALTLSNIKASVKDSFNVDSSDGCPYVTVTLSYSKAGTYTYGSSTTTKNGTGTENSDQIQYKYVNGTWMINSIDIDLYIY